MEITEVKIVQTEYVTVVGYKCDICASCSDNNEDWHNMGHQHSGWGNDSAESYESFDVCSPKCYFEQLEKSIAVIGDEVEGEITGDMSIPFARRLVEYVKNS